MCGDARQAFDAGCALYRTQHYNDALARFETISSPAASTWHNKGHCLYKMGQICKALACFWSADNGASRQQRFINRQLRARCLDALSGSEDRSKREKDSIFATVRFAFQDMYDHMPLLALQCFALLIWYISLIFCCRWWCSLRLYGRICLLFFLFLCNSSIIGLLYEQYVHRKGSRAVIITNCPLRIGPNELYHQIGTVPEGALVSIEKDEGSWRKVCFMNVRGWIPHACTCTIVKNG